MMRSKQTSLWFYAFVLNQEAVDIKSQSEYEGGFISVFSPRNQTCSSSTHLSLRESTRAGNADA